MTKPIDKNGVSISVKRSLIIFYIVMAILIILGSYVDSPEGGCSDFNCGGSFATNLGSNKINIIGTAIGWFWIAPYLAKEAGNLHRSRNFAFVWGALLGVFGAIPYLVYFWIVGDAE
jgi:hypothetical protein